MNDPSAPAPAPPPASDVRVLVADDEELTRTGLRVLLSARPGVDVVGEAADGTEVLSEVRRCRPEVVLMDVRMPGMNGIEATRELRSALDDPPKVVMLTTFESDEYVYDALVAGADGFVLKRTPAQDIAHAVRVVASSDALLFPHALRRLVETRTGPRVTPRRPGLPALTSRETEILRLMATGLSNPDLAARLTVTLETVKTHVSNVLTKLGAQNRTEAVIMAYESGLVVPGTATASPTPLAPPRPPTAT